MRISWTMYRRDWWVRRGESPSLALTLPPSGLGFPPCESVIIIQALTPYNFLHILAHILTHLDRVPPDQRQKQGSSGMAATKPWTLVFGEAVICMLQCRLKALRRLFQRQPERFPSRTVSTTTVLWTVIGFLFCPRADVYLRKACTVSDTQNKLHDDVFNYIVLFFLNVLI